MVTRQSSAKCNGSIVQDTLRAALSGNPILLEALEFLFSNAAESLSFQGLRFQPVIAAHRNLVSMEPFVLPKERFGGSRDVALVSLVRHVVDETLRGYAHGIPHLLEYVGKTPVSPYGSIGLSVSRWGRVDWDFIRQSRSRIKSQSTLPQRLTLRPMLPYGETGVFPTYSKRCGITCA